MPSPPPSSEFEFNLADGGGGLADEVTVLISDARRKVDLTPALATVMTTHKQLILSVLDRQIQLLRSRSQALEDGQVTVYDKALLDLTSDGINLENPSALLFWCEYYLGINNINAPTNTPKFLQEMMAVPTVLNQAVETHPLHRMSGTTVKAESDNSPEPVVFSEKTTDPKLKRLFDVYEQAKTEYLAVVELNDDRNTVAAARFLRDTAENALSILKEKDIDPSVLGSLQETYNKAKEAAVELSGGKKRKFDGPPGDVVNGKSSKIGREERGSYRGSYRGRGRRRGRGHSSIPYGYTSRTVDSYHPY